MVCEPFRGDLPSAQSPTSAQSGLAWKLNMHLQSQNAQGETQRKRKWRHEDNSAAKILETGRKLSEHLRMKQVFLSV